MDDRSRPRANDRPAEPTVDWTVESAYATYEDGGEVTILINRQTVSKAALLRAIHFLAGMAQL